MQGGGNSSRHNASRCATNQPCAEAEITIGKSTDSDGGREGGGGRKGGKWNAR
jgi:hypothetical protein